MREGPGDGRAGATFIGSFVTAPLSAPFAAAQLESLYAALIVFVGLNLLQFVVPSLIALATVCAKHSAARPIAILLSADGRDADEDRRMTDSTQAVD